MGNEDSKGCLTTIGLAMLAACVIFTTITLMFGSTFHLSEIISSKNETTHDQHIGHVPIEDKPELAPTATPTKPEQASSTEIKPIDSKIIMVCQENMAHTKPNSPSYIAVIDSDKKAETRSLSSLYKIDYDNNKNVPLVFRTIFSEYNLPPQRFDLAVEADFDYLVEELDDMPTGLVLEGLAKYAPVTLNHDFSQILIRTLDKSGITNATLNTLLQDKQEYPVSKFLYDKYLGDHTPLRQITKLFNMDANIEKQHFTPTNVVDKLFTLFTRMGKVILMHENFNNITSIDQFTAKVASIYSKTEKGFMQNLSLISPMIAEDLGKVFSTNHTGMATKTDQSEESSEETLLESAVSKLKENLIPLSVLSLVSNFMPETEKQLIKDDKFEVLVCRKSDNISHQSRASYHLLAIESAEDQLIRGYFMENANRHPNSFERIFARADHKAQPFHIDSDSDHYELDLKATAANLDDRMVAKFIYTFDKYIPIILGDDRIQTWLATLDESGLGKAIIRMLFNQPESNCINQHLFRAFKKWQKKAPVRKLLKKLNIKKTDLKFTPDNFLNEMLEKLMVEFENYIVDMKPKENEVEFIGPKIIAVIGKFLDGLKRKLFPGRPVKTVTIGELLETIGSVIFFP